MKPDHRRRISHYQTLKYPVNSLEGQDFMMFVDDPEQINQYIRTYGVPSDNQVISSEIARYNNEQTYSNDDLEVDNSLKVRNSAPPTAQRFHDINQINGNF